jgi:nucleoside-diphosphate-sugar epimerase
MKQDNKSFNKNKVFITGITGFVGYELAKSLVEDGFCVYGLYRHSPRTSEPLKVLRDMGVRTYEGNITDYPYISSIVSEISPDYIIHLAALVPVSLSFQRWDEYYKNNLLGAVYLAEAAMKLVPTLKKFVFASTMEVYGIQDPSKGAFAEDIHLDPNSPYAVAKLAAEQHILNMHRMYKFPSCAVRLANCFGRKYDTYFIIEAVINKILNTSHGSISLGTGDSVRSFIYIKDTVSLYKTLMLSENSACLGQVFNSGPSNGLTMFDLVSIITEEMNFKGQINWGTREYRPGEIFYLNQKNDKVKSLLDWEPKYDLRFGIRECIKYWTDLKENDPSLYNTIVSKV